MALVRAAERSRDHAFAAQPRLARAAEDAVQPAQRLLDRAVDVLAVVRLAGAQEDVDLVEAFAQLERGVQPALVRDEDGDAHAVGNIDSLEHLRRVSQLRDDVGTDEARRLEPPQAGTRESVDQPHLVGGRDDLRLVLEAVAGTDLAHPRRCRQRGHRRLTTSTGRR